MNDRIAPPDYTRFMYNDLMIGHVDSNDEEAQRLHLIKIMYSLHKGADPNKLHKDGNSAMHAAVEKNRPDLITAFLTFKGNVHVRNANNQTPISLGLTKFAKTPEQKIKKSLILQALFSGVHDPNKILNHRTNNSLMHYVGLYGSKDNLIRFVNRNGHLEARNKHGQTPLSVLLAKETETAEERQHKLVMLEALLEAGADPNAVIGNPKDKDTIMHLVARKGDPEIMELLLKHKANPNLQDKWGYTPLHYVAKSEVLQNPITVQEKIVQQKQSADKAKMIRLLHRYKANPFLKDQDGNSAFFYLTDHLSALLEEMIPASTAWTLDQRKSRLLSLFIVDFREGDVTPLLKSEPEDDSTVAKFRALNIIRDKYGQDAGQRPLSHTIFWLKRMAADMTKIMLYTPLVQRYGDYVVNGLSLEHLLTSPHHILRNDKKDKLADKDEQRLLTYYSRQMMRVYFGPLKDEQIPAASPAKMIEAMNRWRNKWGVINKEINTLPPIHFETVIKEPVEMSNGWQVSPVASSPVLFNLSDRFHNCGYYLWKDCGLCGAQLYTLGKTLEQPEYMFGFDLNGKRISDPVGYNNNPQVPADAQQDANDFQTAVFAGKIGELQQVKLAYDERKDHRRHIINPETGEPLPPLLTEVTFNTEGKKGMDNARHAKTVFSSEMQDTLRFRHDDLETMFKRTKMEAIMAQGIQHFHFAPHHYSRAVMR